MGQSYFSSNTPDVNIFAELHLSGKVYPLESFKTEIDQEVSEGDLEPKNEVNGGLLNLTIVQFPDEAILRWASSRWARKSGEIVFKNDTTTPSLRISFTDAACVMYSQTCGEGIGCYISLTITAKSISFNDISLDKNWVE